MEGNIFTITRYESVGLEVMGIVFNIARSCPDWSLEGSSNVKVARGINPNLNLILKL